jgi:hypothetical protein
LIEGHPEVTGVLPVQAGDEVARLLKRGFFIELQSRFGNIFFVRQEVSRTPFLPHSHSSPPSGICHVTNMEKGPDQYHAMLLQTWIAILRCLCGRVYATTTSCGFYILPPAVRRCPMIHFASSGFFCFAVLGETLGGRKG